MPEHRISMGMINPFCPQEIIVVFVNALINMPRTKEKYYKAEQIIRDNEKYFKSFLKEHYQGSMVDEQLDRWAKNSEVLIFSGVIRDFFLGRDASFRDLDVVLTDIDERLFIDGAHCNRNQFGGTKLTIGDKTIDVWQLRDTWGIKHKGMIPFPFVLMETSFYNFSSIVYNYNEERFYYGKEFVEFLAYKSLDIVYAENPIPELCVVNSLWYSQSFGLKLSKRLKEWLKDHYDETIDYGPVQLRHFGMKRFTNEEIRVEFYKILQ